MFSKRTVRWSAFAEASTHVGQEQEAPTLLELAKRNAGSRLQEHLDAFVRRNDLSDAALMRYFRGIVRIVDTFPELSDLKRYRPQLIGLYFEAGMRMKRNAGRPSTKTQSGLPVRHLLLFLWDRVNLERGRALGAGAIPAKEIAARLSEWKTPPLTPEQIRKLLKPSARN